MEFLHDLFDQERLRALIQWGGFALLFLIVFAETGLFIGFFLPGDSLLFTAGALVATGFLKPPAFLPQDPLSAIVILNVLLIVAAITGSLTGYWFGQKAGGALFAREDSRFFKRRHLEKTKLFYEKHGPKTIILARWIPFARTFAPIVAGAAGMPFPVFNLYNIIGGATWVVAMTVLGYAFANNDAVKHHNEKIIIGIIVVSVLPAIYHTLKERRAGGTDSPQRHGDTEG